MSPFYIIYRGISSPLYSSALSNHLAFKKKRITNLQLKYFFLYFHWHLLYNFGIYFCKVVLSGRLLDAIFSIFCQTFFFHTIFSQSIFLYFYFFFYHN